MAISTIAVSWTLVIVVCTILATAQAANTDCTPTFPGFHINNDYDAINQGCYKTTTPGAIFPANSVTEISLDVDWAKMFLVGHAKEAVQKCGELALEKGATHFGLYDYGNCYYGNAPDVSQTPHVTSSDDCDKYCEWDIGGPGAMVVYKTEAIVSKPECQSQQLGYRLSSTSWAMNQGCYRSGPGASIFPRSSVHSLFPDINWLRINIPGHGGPVIQECGRLAQEKGFAYFGVENYGMCYFGNAPDYSSGQVPAVSGCLMSCSMDIGHTHVMVVYGIEEI